MSKKTVWTVMCWRTSEEIFRKNESEDILKKSESVDMLGKWWYVDNEDGHLERFAFPQLKLVILFSEFFFETTTPIFPRCVRGFCFNWMCGTFWDRSLFGIPQWDGTHKYIFQRLFEEDGRCIYNLGIYINLNEAESKSLMILFTVVFAERER